MFCNPPPPPKRNENYSTCIYVCVYFSVYFPRLFDLEQLMELDVSHNHLQWLSEDIGKLR